MLCVLLLVVARGALAQTGIPFSPYGGAGGYPYGQSAYGGAGGYPYGQSVYGGGSQYGASFYGGQPTLTGIPSHQSLTSGGTYYRGQGGSYLGGEGGGGAPQGSYQTGTYQQNALRQIANPYNGYGRTTTTGGYNGGYGNFYGGTRYNGLYNGVQYGYGGQPAFQPKLEVSLTGPGGFPVHNSQVSAVAQYGLPGTPYGGQLYNNQLFASAGMPGYSPSYAQQIGGSQYLYPGGQFGASQQQQNSVSFSNFG